jgi:drug/metabolite transporter (DMT)-like permease
MEGTDPAPAAVRDRSATARRVGVGAAPWVFVLLWSTGFVGAKYGLPYAEPFTFLALRLGIAAVLLAGLTVALRFPWPAGRAQYAHAAVVGVLLHAGYLGGVFLAISLGMPAGVSAVVVSLQPVLTALLAVRLLGERLVGSQWLGLVLGIVGVLLVLAPGLVAAVGDPHALPVDGTVSCLVALAAGTAGTLYQKRHGGGIPLVSGTAVQYLAAGLVLLAGALAVETMDIRWTGHFVVAMVWLVVALSLGAVLLLLFLLRRGTAAGVSSLLYLVPPAVAVEAYLLFGEDLPPVSLLGVAVTAAGVALVLRPRRGPA